jgi:hypothetical protein
MEIVRYGHLETKERELRDKNTVSYNYGNQSYRRYEPLM